MLGREIKKLRKKKKLTQKQVALKIGIAHPIYRSIENERIIANEQLVNTIIQYIGQSKESMEEIAYDGEFINKRATY